MLRAATTVCRTATKQQCLWAVGAASAVLLAAKSRGAYCAVPAPARELFQDLVRDFEPLVAESDGWRQDASQRGDGFEIQVRSAPSSTKGVHARRYRMDITVEPALAARTDEDAAFRKLMCPKERLEWDSNLSFKEFLLEGEKVCPEERPEVIRFLTAPAAGGLISPREFLDARLVLPGCGLGGKILVTRRWDTEMSLQPASGCTRAYNVAGCMFIHVRKDSEGYLRITMFGQSEIGGWIPVSVVNSASSGGYVKVATGLLKALSLA